MITAYLGGGGFGAGAGFGGGGGPDATTASNVGAGAGVFKTKVFDDLRFKSLVAGTNIGIMVNADDLNISTAAEINTASNLGAGNGLYASKVGVDLRFKSLVAGAGIVMSPTANDITLNTITPPLALTAPRIPYCSAAPNVLSDTVNQYNAVTGFTGFNISPAATVHLLGKSPIAGVACGLRVDARVDGAGIPLVGFGGGIEFYSRMLSTGAVGMVGSIEIPLRAASDAVGVATMNFYARANGGSNRLMLSLLPSTLTPQDNRVIVYGATTIQIDGTGAGAANMPFAITRTDSSAANVWGITIPITLVDSGAAARVVSRFNFEWESYTAATSRIYLYGLKSTVATINQTWLKDTAGLFNSVPGGVFDISDETATKTLAHLIFSSSAYTNSMTNFLPANSWGGILAGYSGSLYPYGGMIIRGISQNNVVGLQLQGYSHTDATQNLVSFTGAIDDGAGGLTYAANVSHIFAFYNYTRLLIDITENAIYFSSFGFRNYLTSILMWQPYTGIGSDDHVIEILGAPDNTGGRGALIFVSGKDSIYGGDLYLGSGGLGIIRFLIPAVGLSGYFDAAGGFGTKYKFGCNSASPQASYASGGAVSSPPSTTPTSGGYGWVDGTEMYNWVSWVNNALNTQLNNCRIALVNDGIMS